MTHDPIYNWIRGPSCSGDHTESTLRCSWQHVLSGCMQRGGGERKGCGDWLPKAYFCRKEDRL